MGLPAIIDVIPTGLYQSLNPGGVTPIIGFNITIDYFNPGGVSSIFSIGYTKIAVTVTLLF